MQALRVCAQVPCNNVTTNMLRLGDPHIAVVLTSSRGTAHIDALIGRSEASFEALQGTGCVDATTTCMEFHDALSAVAVECLLLRRQPVRERAAPAAGVLLPLVASHAIIVCPLIMGGMPH
ncbi:hypothetical protein TcBrA4_0023620 [Trypanosoma cruzi]|nr:hypothetical protein TcBrA4_0023620 [Trypanosoma cruzi]